MTMLNWIVWNRTRLKLKLRQTNFLHIMYTYLNVCKEMTDVKSWMLCSSNTWNHLTASNNYAASCPFLISMELDEETVYFFLNIKYHNISYEFHSSIL